MSFFERIKAGLQRRRVDRDYRLQCQHEDQERETAAQVQAAKVDRESLTPSERRMTGADIPRHHVEPDSGRVAPPPAPAWTPSTDAAKVLKQYDTDPAFEKLYAGRGGKDALLKALTRWDESLVTRREYGENLTAFLAVTRNR